MRLKINSVNKATIDWKVLGTVPYIESAFPSERVSLRNKGLRLLALSTELILGCTAILFSKSDLPSENILMCNNKTIRL